MTVESPQLMRNAPKIDRFCSRLAKLSAMVYL